MPVADGKIGLCVCAQAMGRGWVVQGVLWWDKAWDGVPGG